MTLRPLILIIALLAWPVITMADSPAPATQPASQRVVRCAVIGGIAESGMWAALAERFERDTGVRVETVTVGNKEAITPAFRAGGIDLITLHASDEIVNLVADGLARDPQPWARNDLVIVGPVNDPAKVKGMTDAGEALRKIADARAAFVVHASLGAQGVLRRVLDDAGVELDPERTTMLLDDRQRRVLKIAAERNAYTLVGRIPFRSGKLPSEGMAVMVEGDERLRRPYVVAVADEANVKGVHADEARQLAAYLRSRATQAWLAEYGKGQFDDRPLFFPVSVPGRP